MNLAQHLLNHLWQSTLFAAAAGLLTLALRSNQAELRHRVWLAASVKFLVPFALVAGLSSHLVSRVARPIGPTALYFAIEEIGQPFRQLEARVISRTAAPATPARLPILLVCVWFCGCAAVLVFWGMRWQRVNMAVRTALPIRDGRALEAMRRLARIARIERQISLMSSTSTLEPGIFGIFRPVLLLPAGISDRLSDAQLDAILAHELCHVRRRDNLAAAIHMVVEAAFWFHPLVWWLGARLVEERERACDEEVLRRGSDPEAYAESILKVCQFYLESPLECVAGVTGSDLKKRIEEIMTHRIPMKLDFGRKLLLIAAALAAVAGPIAIGLASAPRSDAQQQQPVAGRLAFDVASVKPSQIARAGGEGSRRERIDRSPGSLTMRNVSISFCIQWAYSVKFYQISGPRWLVDERYDIVAKASGSHDDGQLRLMLQTLLADRFKLKLHREKKELPVYALVVGKDGPKLRPSTADGDSDMQVAAGSFVFQRTSMQDLADRLSDLVGVDRPVIDETGIKGVFDVTLKSAARAALEGDGPSIFTSLREQLGLRLEPRKGRLEILVVDFADKVPTEN